MGRGREGVAEIGLEPPESSRDFLEGSESRSGGPVALSEGKCIIGFRLKTGEAVKESWKKRSRKKKRPK